MVCLHGGFGAHYGAERLSATVIPMSGGQTEKQAQLIRDFQPDMTDGDAVLLSESIEELERQMAAMPAAVHCGSASLALSRGRWRCARKSKRRLGSPPWIFTVCRKSWDRAVAMECLKPLTARLSGKTTFPGIVNPDDGTPLEDGEHGELFTTLTKEALPVIRYRTRDLTRLLPELLKRRTKTTETTHKRNRVTVWLTVKHP